MVQRIDHLAIESLLNRLDSIQFCFDFLEIFRLDAAGRLVSLGKQINKRCLSSCLILIDIDTGGQILLVFKYLNFVLKFLYALVVVLIGFLDFVSPGDDVFELGDTLVD